MPTVSSILIACGGFLLAVLWMDLMFDVQVQRSGRSVDDLPEETLVSIAAYYRRVTTDARPLGYLIGAVMIVTLISVTVQITFSPALWVGLTSLPLCGGPTLLALSRVYPNAVRLGIRLDSPRQQSALARSIYRDHLLCLGGILAFLALQLSAAP